MQPGGPDGQVDSRSVSGEVVIGEAVALELRPARVPSRALSFVVDLAVVAVLLFVLLLVIVLAGDRFDSALGAAVIIVLVVGVGVGWPTLWETLTRGRTPGKFALGLRVVRDDGGPIGFRHAVTRALAGLVVDFGILSLSTGVVGIVVAASNERGKRVGDLLAGTMVVRERVPRSTATASGPPPGVHPQLAGWASGLQLAALPDDLALAARQYLGRVAQFAPAARRSLGERLATEVAGHVAPAPPPGVPAEVYLAAVLGERHRREMARYAPPRPPGPVPAGSYPQAGPYAQAGPPPGPVPAPASSPWAAPRGAGPPAPTDAPSTSPRGFSPPG